MLPKPFATLALLCSLCLLPPCRADLPNAPQQNHDQTIARQAMIAALKDDNSALQSILIAEMRATESKHRSPSLNKMLLLHAWSLKTPANRIQVLNTILSNNPSETESRVARHALASTLPQRLDNLRQEDRFNRFAHTFNFFSKLATSLVTANVQAVIRQTLGIFFVSQRLTEVSPRNRAEYNLYLALQENPDQFSDMDVLAVSESPRLSKRQETLASRIAKRTALEETVRGEWDLRRQHWHEARAAFARAQKLDPSERSRKGQLEAARQISALLRAQVLSAEMPMVRDAYSLAEGPAARQLALALCDGPLEYIRNAAIHLQQLNPQSTFHDDAAYAELVARQLLAKSDDMECDEAPRRLLENPTMQNTNAVHHLKARESSPLVNRAIHLTQAEKQRKSETRRYILLGEMPDHDGPRIITFQDKLNRAVNNIGLLLPVQWIIRSVVAIRKKPVDDGQWRDAAIQYLTHATPNPLSPQFIAGPDVRESILTTDTLAHQTALSLALSYEKSDRFAEARLWYTLAKGTLPDEIDDRLSQRAAKKLLTQAKELANPAERRNLLEYILNNFPQTPTADKARKELGKAEKPEEETAPWQITKKELAARPDLWMGQGLWLNPQWFDNGEVNGELREEGVRFLDMEGSKILFTIDEPKGPVGYSRIATPNTRENYKAALAIWKREIASRRRAAELFEHPALPMSLDASAGPSGFDIYPRLIPLPFDSEALPLYK